MIIVIWNNFELDMIVLIGIALAGAILLLLYYGPEFFEIYTEVFAFILTVVLFATLSVGSFFVPKWLEAPLQIYAGLALVFIPIVVEAYNSSSRGYQISRHLPRLSRLFDRGRNAYFPLENIEEASANGDSTAEHLKRISSVNYLADCSELSPYIHLN